MTTTYHPALTESRLFMLAVILEEQSRFRLEQVAELSAASAAVETDAEREIRDTILYGARIALRDIKAALARLADGSYGWCIDCGARLSLDRLEVLPHAARCITCQRGTAPAR